MLLDLGRGLRRLNRGLWVTMVVLVALSTAGAQVRPLGELRDVLGQDDGNERRKAAEALGEHHNPAAVALLIETYRAEVKDAFGVRAACARALGDTGQPAAVAALEEILGDPDYWVRKQAASALGQLPGTGATAALAAAARDLDPRVRGAAVLQLGGRDGSGELLLRAYRDPEASVAAAALEALVAARHPQAGEYLERSLAEAPWQMRYRAASLLARAGDPRGLAELASAVRSGLHAGAALREAAGVGDPAVESLAALYQDAARPLAARVLDTLEGMPGVQATAFFAALATDPGAPAEDRARATAVLFDRREALTAAQMDEIAGLLDAADANLAAVALQILLERGSPGYLSRVEPLVHHDNKVVRHFALSNLWRYGGEQYESSFLEALGDANGANVRLALEALGEAGSAQSLPAIRALEENRKYRRYAQTAAEAIEARAR